LKSFFKANLKGKIQEPGQVIHELYDSFRQGLSSDAGEQWNLALFSYLHAPVARPSARGKWDSPRYWHYKPVSTNAEVPTVLQGCCLRPGGARDPPRYPQETSAHLLELEEEALPSEETATLEELLRETPLDLTKVSSMWNLTGRYSTSAKLPPTPVELIPTSVLEQFVKQHGGGGSKKRESLAAMAKYLLSVGERHGQHRLDTSRDEVELVVSLHQAGAISDTERLEFFPWSYKWAEGGEGQRLLEPGLAKQETLPLLLCLLSSAAIETEFGDDIPDCLKGERPCQLLLATLARHRIHLTGLYRIIRRYSREAVDDFVTIVGSTRVSVVSHPQRADQKLLYIIAKTDASMRKSQYSLKFWWDGCHILHSVCECRAGSAICIHVIAWISSMQLHNTVVVGGCTLLMDYIAMYCRLYSSVSEGPLPAYARADLKILFNQEQLEFIGTTDGTNQWKIIPRTGKPSIELARHVRFDNPRKKRRKIFTKTGETSADQGVIPDPPPWVLRYPLVIPGHDFRDPCWEGLSMGYARLGLLGTFTASKLAFLRSTNDEEALYENMAAPERQGARLGGGRMNAHR